MADLEDQLRRYALVVESSVAPVAHRRAQMTRSRRRVGWVAVAAIGLGLGVGIGAALSDGPVEPNTRVDREPAASTSSSAPFDPPSSSSDAEERVVPPVRGLTLVEAIQVLHDAGIGIVGDPVEENASDVEKGRATRTEPVAGSVVTEGTAVALFLAGDLVAEPPLVVSVPPVIGLFADHAMAALRDTGLVPIIELQVVPLGDPRVGTVIEQAPEALSDVDRGSVVVIVVGEPAAGPLG